MYIFNPKYKLKDDVERIMIINESYADYMSDSYMSFVHPIYAWILNLFDGKSENGELLLKISQDLGITENEARNLIKPLLNNPSEVAIRYDGVVSRFPPYVLIDNVDNKCRSKEDDDFFSAITIINHNSWRLFKPINLLICPTLRCYTDCIYCYANRGKKHYELDYKIWVNFIEQAKKYGIERIDVTGGEFFLKQGWFKIAKSLSENGYYPDISTKIPLSNSIIDSFLDSGQKRLQISLDTMDTDVAIQTLCVNNKYIEQILNTIVYANRVGLHIILKPTLTKYTCTVENITKILQFAKSLRYIDRVVVSIIGYSCYKDQEFFPQIRPSLTQISEIRSFLEICNNKYDFPVIDDTFIYTAQEMRNNDIFRNRARCTANVEGFVVLPDGMVTLCEELYWNQNFIIGNITQKTITEIWQSPEALKLANLNQMDMPLYSECKLCENLETCHKKRGVCWKLVMSAYGENRVFAPDPRCPKAPVSDVPFTY